MASDDSVTNWFQSLQEGDRGAAQQLWEHFAVRLITLARKRFQAHRQGADDEDVVLSAFDSFCRGAERGRFPQLRDRDGLWQLLITITLRKVSDQVQREQRQKRGGGTVLREADLEGSNPSLNAVMCSEPDPQLAAEMTEQCEHLLARLTDDDLRTIALLKMEGYTNHEVAERLGCARSTVQRRLNLIKTYWTADAL